jgi:hypothetical protein
MEAAQKAEAAAAQKTTPAAPAAGVHQQHHAGSGEGPHSSSTFNRLSLQKTGSRELVSGGTFSVQVHTRDIHTWGTSLELLGGPKSHSSTHYHSLGVLYSRGS